MLNKRKLYKLTGNKVNNTEVNANETCPSNKNIMLSKVKPNMPIGIKKLGHSRSGIVLPLID